MKRRIENITELRKEILLLEELSHIQEAKIKADLKDIAQSLRPGNLLQNAASSIIHSKKEKNPLFTQGIALATGLLAEKVLFRKSSMIFKSIMSFALKKVATNAVSEKPESIVEKVKRMFSFITPSNGVEKRENVYPHINNEKIRSR